MVVFHYLLVCFAKIDKRLQMKNVLSLFLGLMMFSFLIGCSHEEGKEQNSTVVFFETNDTEVDEVDIVEEEFVEEFEEIEEVIIQKSATVTPTIKKVDTTPPMKPTVKMYSNLLEKNLQLIVQGEIGAKVYIESMFYGTIDSSQELKIDLTNPHESYFETFEVVLSDEAGNDSSPLICTTTFQRAKLDKKYTYYVPQSINFLNRGFSDKGMVLTSYPKDKNDAVALIIPFHLEGNQTDILKLNPVVRAIQQTQEVSEFIHLSTHELTKEQTVIAEYALLTHKPISTIGFMKSITYNINKENLYYLDTENELAKYRYFNIKVSLLQKYRGESYLSFSIVPNKFTLPYQNMINTMINSQNIKRDTEPIYLEEEKFTPYIIDKEQQYANFLFVIDDSGSMGDYQKAIAETAKEFALAVKNVGMNFRVAIITTGGEGEAFEFLETEGIIENNRDAFKNALKVGTEGSSTETAIYNVEQALLSKQDGAKKDGILTQLNMPRANERLSVIILSDEWSSYKERAGKAFDLEENIFVNRGYTVYLIGSPKEYNHYSYRKETFQHASNDYGLYGQLARVTGGLVEDIRNIYSYKSIMNSITQNVLGDLGYKLKQKNIIESTIYVLMNGEEVLHNHKNGWRYVVSTNSILFSGTAVPTEDDTIVVRYSYSLDE